MKNIFILFFLLSSVSASGSVLFNQTQSILNIRVFGDFSNQAHEDKIHGKIQFLNKDKSYEQFFVDFIPYGNTRRVLCNFLPMKVRFKNYQRAISYLGNISKTLYLTTHCDSKKGVAIATAIFTRQSSPTKLELKDYVVGEELAYRLFQTFYGEGLKTQLLKIEYNDTGENSKYIHYGFFVENFKDFQRRRGFKEIAEGHWLTGKINLKNINKLQLFKFRVVNKLLAHNDSSIESSSNVVNFRRENRSLFPVAYDFDASIPTFIPLIKLGRDSENFIAYCQDELSKLINTDYLDAANNFLYEISRQGDSIANIINSSSLEDLNKQKLIDYYTIRINDLTLKH